MKTRIFVIAASSVLILAISACSLPSSKTNNNRKQNMALTVTAQALIIQNSTNQATTKRPIIRTPHPRNTPGGALASTPGAPMVSVSSPTNCRTGPSTDYDLLYTLNVGETAEVVGKYSGGNYWVINNPDGGGNCWLWGEYATISGDTDNLSEMIPPPAPVAKVHPKKPTPADTPVPTHAPMFILPFFLIPSPTPTLNHNLFRPYVPILP